MKKRFLYCLFDGVLQGFIFTLLTEYLSSQLFNKIHFLNILVVAVLMLSSILSTIFFVNKRYAKLWKGYLISSIAFIFTLLLSFINSFTLKIRFLPIRELSNADGLYIFYCIISFLLFLLVSRLISIIIQTIRKRFSD